MARPSKDDESLQKKWQDRIDRALKKQKEWKEQFRVDLARDYFEGKQNPGYPSDEWITINKVYSHLMAQLPSLYSVDPYFYVKLKQSYSPGEITNQNALAGYVSGVEKKAKIRQAYLNYLKGELDLKPKARLAIQDAHFAYGVLKVHFCADNIENKDYGQTIKGDDGEELKGEDGNPLQEPEYIPINERYKITRVHPDDFLWDEDAGPLEDSWCWVAQRIFLTKDEAKNDTRFTKSFLKGVKPKSRDDRKNTFPTGDEDRSERDVYVLWEIYDLKKNKWLTIVEDAHKVLSPPDDLPDGTETHPYGILRFTLRHDSPYPIPPVSQALDPQKEFCLARSRILTHRKRFNRKYAVVTSMLDGDADQEISKLENGDDGTCIRMMNTGAVAPINDAPLDQQNYLEVNALNIDITDMMGSASEARGIADAESATQADIMDKRLEVREGDRLSLVVDLLTTIAEKLDQLVQTHISRDEAVRITGPQGEFWELVKQSDYESITGQFEYSMNVGASMARLPQLERAQWMAFMSQVIVPFPHVLTAPRFMRRMAEMFGIEDEAALEELRQIGLQMMSGKLPMPGGAGSAQGVPEDNPVTKVLGAAMGALGGNVNGGGAPGGMMTQANK